MHNGEWDELSPPFFLQVLLAYRDLEEKQVCLVLKVRCNYSSTSWWIFLALLRVADLVWACNVLVIGAKKSIRLRKGKKELNLVIANKYWEIENIGVVEQSRRNTIGLMELYWRKWISSLILSDIRISVFPLWFFLMHEILLPSDLSILFFNHPWIFQVRKEPLEPLVPKVCWAIRYLLWIFSLDSFRYGYCPWILTLSFFDFFFCALVRQQT